MYAYQAQGGVDVRVARIFNTFGPRMNPYDGRVVSNFIIQALQVSRASAELSGREVQGATDCDSVVQEFLGIAPQNFRFLQICVPAEDQSRFARHSI